MPTVDTGIDVIAYDNVGRAVLIAEVKVKAGATPPWAARFRSNMLAHGSLPKALFFLIATPERIYFWRQDGETETDALPEFTLNAEQEFKPYLERMNKAPRAIGGEALELLVFSWLTDMARSGAERVKQDNSMKWLADSGLIGSLENARIEMNPA